MADTVRNIQQTSVETQKVAPERPWLRQDGESTLWFNRFNRYMNLGPKRSLQAAVEQEQAQISALKSTKEQPKRERSSQKKSSVKSGDQIRALPAAKPQVPGSWKAACKQWQWVERAKAYDASVIDRWAQRNIDHAFSEIYSNTAGRVMALNALFETEQEMFNSNSAKMSFEQFNGAMARMQSILRDIRDEMKIYDEDVTRQGMRIFASKQYKESFGEKEKLKKYQG